MRFGGGGGGDISHDIGDIKPGITGIFDGDNDDENHRNKFGPSVSINHFNPHRNRYSLSSDWYDSGISAKTRNTSTKNKLKRAKGDDGDWYQKNAASKRVHINREFMTAKHSRLQKNHRRNRHIQPVLKHYGF